MKKYLPIIVAIFFTVLLLNGLPCSGQAKQKGGTKIDIENADTFSSRKTGDKEIRRLIGHVILRQDDVVMFCDSALFYSERNFVNAYGNIHIRQGDSIDLYGQELEYDGNTKYAVIRKNVRLQDKEMSLTTDRLDYNMETRQAYYTNGGTMRDAENTLTSQRGYFYAASHNLFFRKDVVLDNPSYKMVCDTLQYNVESRRATFHGPTTITSQQDMIYCEGGFYNTLRNTAQFTQKAYLRSDGQFLYGDSLYYDRNKTLGKAMGNVRVLDTAERLLLEGQYAEHYENTRKTFITRNVLVTKGFTRDSLYMRADTVTSSYDSTRKYRILKGFRHVKVFNPEFQAVCDSIVYSFVDSTLDMRVDPVFWFGEYQASADHILIHTKDNSITQADLNNNAFMATPEDTLRYSQVKGRDMVGLFTNGELYRIDVNGNGESIYYVKDDAKAYIGMNYVSSSSIKIGVTEQKLSRINFINDADASMKPLKDVDPRDAILKGFNWRGAEQPKSVEALRAPLK